MKNEGTILAERKAQTILGIIDCGANSKQLIELVDVLEKFYYDAYYDGYYNGYDMGLVSNNKEKQLDPSS